MLAETWPICPYSSQVTCLSISVAPPKLFISGYHYLTLYASFKPYLLTAYAATQLEDGTLLLALFLIGFIVLVDDGDSKQDTRA